MCWNRDGPSDYVTWQHAKSSADVIDSLRMGKTVRSRKMGYISFRSTVKGPVLFAPCFYLCSNVYLKKKSFIVPIREMESPECQAVHLPGIRTSCSIDDLGACSSQRVLLST